MFEKIERFLKNKKKAPTPIDSIRELTGLHVAILATDGFEESELFEPRRALMNAGAVVHIISLRPGRIRGSRAQRPGRSIRVDMTVREAWSVEFDALILPGGLYNPDKLRANSEAVAFVMSFINKKRPIGAICHGIQTLIETGSVKGMKLTSWPSLKTDLVNAGATWLDQEVVIDHKLVTSRKPADIPAFNDAIIREFSYQNLHRGLPSTEGYAVTL